ncbi:F0F1 ATP synthase subunit gamma [Synechococcus sp. PCC 7336]|uniref:F0F1 ATP synthase subunit gamma n=1 Tax=Synechococcus sp. PCC 7336 TaxID=195250 RepID=UPI00034B94AC|nr:F0F1 ATP synthase subunit gamma [Synechococcus sp. PCC 7336]
MGLTPEALQAKIESVEDLQAIVKTMKALASVSIQQYRKAMESLEDYSRTVEMGLQVMLQQQRFSDRYGPDLLPKSTAAGRVGALVWGSDRGLCGQFDERIAAYTAERLKGLKIEPANISIAAIGARIETPMGHRGYPVAETVAVPNSATEIMPAVQNLLFAIEEWRSQQQIERILLFYNRPLTAASYRSYSLQLCPVDASWLHRLQDREWPSQALPMFTIDARQLFSEFIREYFFVSLYRAFAASLASENASRLSAMQSAEKNIEERLAELKARYHRQRQSAITAELLDIVAGFEALT